MQKPSKLGSLSLEILTNYLWYYLDSSGKEAPTFDTDYNKINVQIAEPFNHLMYQTCLHYYNLHLSIFVNDNSIDSDAVYFPFKL